MHTIRRQDKDQWIVGCLETSSEGGTLFYNLFHGLSLHAAIKLCSALNGGEFSPSDNEVKILQMCAS